MSDVLAALTQAGRHPVFYAEMGVPDTVMGRFEMISAHMVLFFRRTGRGGADLRALAQDVVDAFFEDLDHSIREIGIGDMGVPKRMKKLARMFYGRYEAYDAAIEAGDRAALAVALGRNIHPGASAEAGEERAAGLDRLADHVFAVDAAFAAQDERDLMAGRLAVPAPESVSAPPGRAAAL